MDPVFSSVGSKTNRASSISPRYTAFSIRFQDIRRRCVPSSLIQPVPILRHSVSSTPLHLDTYPSAAPFASRVHGETLVYRHGARGTRSRRSKSSQDVLSGAVMSVALVGYWLGGLYLASRVTKMGTGSMNSGGHDTGGVCVLLVTIVGRMTAALHSRLPG